MSLSISTGTVMKNQEMLKFATDHLKTKKLRKHAFKKLLYLLRYVLINTRLTKFVIKLFKKMVEH